MRPTTEQINSILVYETPGEFDKEYEATRQLSMILGEIMSSRLFIEIRDKRGLAYRVGSYLENLGGRSKIEIFCGSDVNKADEYFDAVRGEIDKICSQKVSDDELSMLQKNRKYDLRSAQDSVMYRMKNNAETVMTGLPILSLQEEMRKIDAVGAEDIRDVAQKIFSRTPAMGIISPTSMPHQFQKFEM